MKAASPFRCIVTLKRNKTDAVLRFWCPVRGQRVAWLVRKLLTTLVKKLVDFHTFLKRSYLSDFEVDRLFHPRLYVMFCNDRVL